MNIKASPEPAGGAFASAQHVLTDPDAAIVDQSGRRHADDDDDAFVEETEPVPNLRVLGDRFRLAPRNVTHERLTDAQSLGSGLE